jgi:hypothetical protein
MNIITETLRTFAILVIFCMGIVGIAALITGENTATSQEVDL